jgi:hypothetical protein
MGPSLHLNRRPVLMFSFCPQSERGLSCVFLCS